MHTNGTRRNLFFIRQNKITLAIVDEQARNERKNLFFFQLAFFVLCSRLESFFLWKLLKKAENNGMLESMPYTISWYSNLYWIIYLSFDDFFFGDFNCIAWIHASWLFGWAQRKRSIFLKLHVKLALILPHFLNLFYEWCGGKERRGGGMVYVLTWSTLFIGY